MTLRLATAAGAVVLVAIGASAAPARAAAPTVLKGKLSPGKVKLPKSGRKGQAQVVAMNVDTSAFGAAARRLAARAVQAQAAGREVGAALVCRGARQAFRLVPVGEHRRPGRGAEAQPPAHAQAVQEAAAGQTPRPPVEHQPARRPALQGRGDRDRAVPPSSAATRRSSRWARDPRHADHGPDAEPEVPDYDRRRMRRRQEILNEHALSGERVRRSRLGGRAGSPD